MSAVAEQKDESPGAEAQKAPAPRFGKAKPAGGESKEPAKAAAVAAPRFGKKDVPKSAARFGKKKDAPEKPEDAEADPPAEETKPESKPVEEEAKPEAKAAEPADNLDSLFADEGDDGPKKLRRKKKPSALDAAEDSPEPILTKPLSRERNKPIEEPPAEPSPIKNADDDFVEDDMMEDPANAIIEPAAQVIPAHSAAYKQEAIPGQGSYLTPLDGRYCLAWNLNGRLFKTKIGDMEMFSYEVDREESSRFKLTTDFVQGDVTATGVVMSSGEKLKYMTESVSRDEWEIDLQVRSVAVALCGEFVAVATEDQCLQILSVHGGADVACICLPGTPIALAGGASKPQVTVFYTNGGRVYMEWFDIETRARLCKCEVSLCPEADLAWAHISKSGAVYTMDSKNVLRMLNREFGWSWCPMADLGHRTSVHPLYVDTKATSLYISASTEDNTPDTKVPPEEVKMKYRLAVVQEEGASFAGINEILLRKKLFADQQPADKKPKKSTIKTLEKLRLKLFNYAMQKGCPNSTMLHIAKMFHNQMTENAAMKIATGLGVHDLAGKLSNLYKKKSEAREKAVQAVQAAQIRAAPVLAQPPAGVTPVRGVKRQLETTTQSTKSAKPKMTGLVKVPAKTESPAVPVAKKARKNPFGKK